jgi:hypothetical protein
MKKTTTYIILFCFFLYSKNVNSQDSDFHIYICFGQSNMAGAGTIEAQDQTVDSRFQFMKPQDCPSIGQYMGNWYDAIPPLWGCTGGIGPSDYFGRTMVENLPSNIKVGVIVVGVPGCKIELFGKTGYEGLDTYNNVPSQYNGSAYAWALDLAQQAQQDGVIKGFLLHQGESNTGDTQWANKVKAIYDNFVADLDLNASETPLLAGELLYQDQGGVCWSQNTNIADLPNVLPNSYVISAEGLPGQDEFHFNSEGNRTFGVRYAEQMLALVPEGPQVAFNAPLTKNYVAPATISFDIDVSTTSSTITHVDFYSNNETTPFYEKWLVPYGFDWEFSEPGNYNIKAIAYDDAGNTAEDIITITVNPEQESFTGIAHTIPGTIQLENFDVGGNGFAYYDVDAGTNVSPAPDFRTNEDVDIENCSDEGGGYNIGFAMAGEWLEYTVDVQTAGTYNITFRAACDGDNKTISLDSDGTMLAENVAIPNTGGWQTWTDVTVEDVELQAGKQILRLTIGDVDYVNLNYITCTLKDAPLAFELIQGWNLIGCPLEEKTNVETALQSIWQYVDIVKDMDGFYIKTNPTDMNSLTELLWGKGYLIYVNTNCELNWNQ